MPNIVNRAGTGTCPVEQLCAGAASAAELTCSACTVVAYVRAIRSAVSPSMPKEDFLKALDNITPQVDPHRVFIIFTGGEPLMRKDLEECGRACYRREYPWGLVTNGLLLSRQRLDRLLQAGLHQFALYIQLRE